MWADCWQVHASCLALRLADAPEQAEARAATAERLRPEDAHARIREQALPGVSGSEIARVVAEMRWMALVAGQASVEERAPTLAAADERFARYCSQWG